MHFGYSEKTLELRARVKTFIDQKIVPAVPEIHQSHHDEEPWEISPKLETLKEEAKAEGLWNLFLPESDDGAGLTNLEYAPLAEEMGKVPYSSEVFNCSAPDTGNMEVLSKYGSEQQKKQWLEPLLNGEIRSAFAMTEPDVASSDATNMEATAIEDGNEIVCNGKKWYISGFSDPRCKIIILMAVTNPDAPKHARHSMVLVPKDAPGLKFIRHMEVMGRLDAPHGHDEILFDNVRVPKENLILGPGRGFEVAQGRLGPGRIHHCMRAIGAAEVALELLIRRARQRVAFGKPLIDLGGNRDIIANARIDIEQARLLTLKAAYMMDTVGAKGAMSEISQIKVVAPLVTQRIIDQAMQIHGGCGVSDDTPLAFMYGMNRVLRLADGPDEVHRHLIARLEIAKYSQGENRVNLSKTF